MLWNEHGGELLVRIDQVSKKVGNANEKVLRPQEFLRAQRVSEDHAKLFRARQRERIREAVLNGVILAALARQPHDFQQDVKCLLSEPHVELVCAVGGGDVCN